MTKLGEALSDDMERLFNSPRYNDFLNDVVGKGYRDQINEMNLKAMDPDGQERIELSDEYAEYKSIEAYTDDPQPDLYFRGRRASTFGYFANTGRSEVNFDYSDANVAEYMYEHETGKTGLPIRRQFPVEGDHTSVVMATSSDPQGVDLMNFANSMAGIVYKGMEEVLNHPRTLKVVVNL